MLCEASFPSNEDCYYSVLCEIALAEGTPIT
jgi:hypothetical protein